MKSDKRWQGPGIIIARYGDTYALVHFRGAYLEVSLDDMRSTDKILEVLGCDGTLQLHLANTKFPLRYLVGSQTLIFLSKARNEILKRNPITWTNTDTRLSVRDFYENDLNQQIAINELGVEAGLSRFLGSYRTGRRTKTRRRDARINFGVGNSNAWEAHLGKIRLV